MLGGFQFVLDRASSAGDRFRAADDPFDLLRQLRLGGGLPLHFLLAAQLLFLNLSELHARSGQGFARLLQILRQFQMSGSEILHRLLAVHLLGFKRFALFGVLSSSVFSRPTWSRKEASSRSSTGCSRFSEFCLSLFCAMELVSSTLLVFA